MGIKLTYFDFPGRGESIRLLFHYGGIMFEDVRINPRTWSGVKHQTPNGQVPVLDVDGVTVTQSHAIERYAAARSELLPQDPLKLALAEQVLFQLEDITGLLLATRSLDAEAKVPARLSLMNGAVRTKFKDIEKLLTGKKFILGDELCYVDFALFVGLSNVGSGFLDGIPSTWIDEYPVLKEFHHHIASLDTIQAYYADKNGLYHTFMV